MFTRIPHGYAKPADWKGCGYYIEHWKYKDESVYYVYKIEDCKCMVRMGKEDYFLPCFNEAVKEFKRMIEAKDWCRANAR